jgi:hypothetical protein
LGENKGPEATPMKDVNRQEPIDKTNDVEPLIGVTSDGKQPYKKLLINTTGATSEAGTAYPSAAPEFALCFYWDSCYSTFSFMCMFCLLSFAFCVFLPCLLFPITNLT